MTSKLYINSSKSIYNKYHILELNTQEKQKHTKVKVTWVDLEMTGKLYINNSKSIYSKYHIMTSHKQEKQRYTNLPVAT